MRLFCLLLLLLSTSFARAQDWFEIEVIIFEHNNSQSDPGDLERWPRDLDLNWPSPLLELEPAVKREEPVEIFPPYEELVFDQRRMNNDSYALRVRDPYDLLWHKAWKAPLLPEGQAPWILVQASEELGEHFRLEGAIRIHLSRYLHLSTDLWLTEVSGNALMPDVTTGVEPEDNVINQQASDTELASNQGADNLLQEADTRSEFDWSQLPELGSVRWGCSYVRELWPEDSRLLPADYYDDPAPADWYYPFGCRIPSEQIDRDLPYFVNMPTSDLNAENELEINYPELFTEPEPSEADSFINLPDNTNPETVNSALDTQSLLESINVVFRNEGPTELITPKPRIQYPVREIIRIQGKRRMRSGEFHYIDHPKIGVLAIIHPVEKPELDLEQNLDTEFETEPLGAAGN